MPRITAPTVAEHRARRRADVLRAAEQIVVGEGSHALTVSAVAARTGLARPSVYAYFPSSEALLVALVEEGFDRWTATLQDATAGVTSPRELVRGWFRAAALSAAQGNHLLAAALRDTPLPQDTRERLARGHRTAAEPLHAAARELGVTDLEGASALVQGVAATLIERVEAGGDPDGEATRAASFALGGLDALAGR
ncbi:TetR/AcrR family transcriptional regulator [Actinotalea sp. Marseille-Q4924]|uniref:TetR/AcrR family transcriptional regulator n=1 Tax=Actinotalea sp. Marseille-Q4924 TaxID=2866571 RepID=UPI001CE46DFF|nr:TetR/AcrR family transcriptional regulator [Actinotalea sp. Marseille-Q4924]